MDECLKCGKKGHFAAKCVYYKQNKSSNVVSRDEAGDEDDDSDDEEWVTDNDEDDDSDDGKRGIGYVCDKCGKTIKGECNYYEHASSCKVYKGNTCFRCGRKGHYATNCYAKSHVKGYYLN
jgi:hypothetical protein